MSRYAKQRLGKPVGVSTTLTPVGKNFLSSKVRVSWRFAWTDEAEVHEVVFIHSLGSGRKTIEEDGKQVLECHKTQKDFTHAWESRHYLFRVEIEKHSSITKDASYAFSIDGVQYRDMMTRSEVTRYLRDRNQTLAMALPDDKKMSISTQTALTTNDSPKPDKSPHNPSTMTVTFPREKKHALVLARTTETDPFGTAGDLDPFGGEQPRQEISLLDLTPSPTAAGYEHDDYDGSNSHPSYPHTMQLQPSYPHTMHPTMTMDSQAQAQLPNSSFDVALASSVWMDAPPTIIYSDCESLHKHHVSSSTFAAADPFVTVNPFDSSPDPSAMDGSVRKQRSPSVNHLINHFEQLQTSPSAAPLPPSNAALAYTTQLPHTTTTSGPYNGSRNNSNHKIDLSVPSWFGAKEATLVNLDTLTDEKGKTAATNKSTPLNLLLQESQAKHLSSAVPPVPPAVPSAQLSRGEQETIRGIFPEVWK